MTARPYRPQASIRPLPQNPARPAYKETAQSPAVTDGAAVPEAVARSGDSSARPARRPAGGPVWLTCLPDLECPDTALDRFRAVPSLPWTTRAEMEPGSDYLVMASHLPLKRISATVRFFRGVSAIRRQLAAADGLVGYALRAKPLARDYWTLAVWTNDKALRQFMRTPPHVQLMTSLKPYMGRQSSSRGASPRPTAARVWQAPSSA